MRTPLYEKRTTHHHLRQKSKEKIKLEDVEGLDNKLIKEFKEGNKPKEYITGMCEHQVGKPCDDCNTTKYQCQTMIDNDNPTTECDFWLEDITLTPTIKRCQQFKPSQGFKLTTEYNKKKYTVTETTTHYIIKRKKQ